MSARPPVIRVEDLNVWFDLPGGGELHAVQGVTFVLGSGRSSIAGRASHSLIARVCASGSRSTMGVN